ncbi:hypothetical protein [Halosimplex pelagicum]|uniref:Uncharacterized protein n=1 Tax=Halosimplex pelagicum TaxID=869886 RepID=A0A7D5SWX5_9EURY|nr:hypothetical protein [Halosimplex pelagicum]QLH83407.1 hypothetical protein HZS54_17990 [Halosimplex pelagicum]
MPQTEQQPQRSNFFSSAGGEYDPDREPLDDSEPTHDRATASSSNKDEWIAMGILLDGATRTCPNCYEDHDPDDGVGEEPLGVILADKEHAPRECEGRKTVTPATALKWTCSECGYQCFGGILEDRTIPEFLEVVDEVLDAVGRVPDKTRRELRGEALARKRNGVDDRANMTVLISEL